MSAKLIEAAGALGGRGTNVVVRDNRGAS